METESYGLEQDIFELLKKYIPDGYQIGFRTDSGNQLVISVGKNFFGEFINNDQCLPLSDHFYEQKVVKCIDFMVEKLEAAGNVLRKELTALMDKGVKVGAKVRGSITGEVIFLSSNPYRFKGLWVADYGTAEKPNKFLIQDEKNKLQVKVLK